MPANKKIQHALDAIIAIITANYSSGANAIRLRTAKPPNKISVFPAAIAWVGNGKWTKDDATTKRGLHTLKLIIAVAAKGDFQREVTTLMNYSDDVPDKLLGDVALSGNVDTIIVDSHYTTEDDGRALDIFPISEQLRYRLPSPIA